MEERIKNKFNRDLYSGNRKEVFSFSQNKHKGWVEEKINAKRKHLEEDEEIMKVDCDMNRLNIDVVQSALVYINMKNYGDKNLLKSHLKALRRELSKVNITKELLLQIFRGGNFLISLINFLFDFKNSEVQLETLWILNNLCIHCQEVGFKEYFFQIHSFLTDFMLLSEKNFSNNGVKNLILEKFFSLIGNLILNDENVFHHYLSFNILYFLISNLNSSVRSFRAICLWTLNNILTDEHYYSNNYIAKSEENKKIIFENIANNKTTLSYLKNLFVRLDPCKNFEESYEFLWFLNYFVKFSFSDFCVFLFTNTNEKITETKNFKILINLLFVDKLQEPVIRILGNLLVHDGDYVSQYKSDIALALLRNNDFVYFISNILKNLEFEYIVRDALWLIKNLLFYDGAAVVNTFFSSVGKRLLSITNYNNNDEILKNSLIIIYHYYQINGYQDLLSNIPLLGLIFNIFEYDVVRNDICIRLILLELAVNASKLKGNNGSVTVQRVEYSALNNM
jgi:hypothetical protein